MREICVSINVSIERYCPPVDIDTLRRRHSLLRRLFRYSDAVIAIVSVLWCWWWFVDVILWLFVVVVAWYWWRLTWRIISYYSTDKWCAAQSSGPDIDIFICCDDGSCCGEHSISLEHWAVEELMMPFCCDGVKLISFHCWLGHLQRPLEFLCGWLMAWRILCRGIFIGCQCVAAQLCAVFQLLTGYWEMTYIIFNDSYSIDVFVMAMVMAKCTPVMCNNGVMAYVMRGA